MFVVPVRVTARGSVLLSKYNKLTSKDMTYLGIQGKNNTVLSKV